MKVGTNNRKIPESRNAANGVSPRSKEGWGVKKGRCRKTGKKKNAEEVFNEGVE